MIILVILIPFITGILVPIIPFRKRWHKEVFLETAVRSEERRVGKEC